MEAQAGVSGDAQARAPKPAPISLTRSCAVRIVYPTAPGPSSPMPGRPLYSRHTSCQGGPGPVRYVKTRGPSSEQILHPPQAASGFKGSRAACEEPLSETGELNSRRVVPRTEDVGRSHKMIISLCPPASNQETFSQSLLFNNIL